MVVSAATIVVPGNGKSGFDSEERVWETATTSKEGNGRANFLYSRHEEVVMKYKDTGHTSNPRDNLVPAAVMTLALIAYIKYVTIKKLVVESCVCVCIFRPNIYMLLNAHLHL